MSTGIVIITAKDADAKLVNRFLLHVRDWEFESGDRFRVMLSPEELTTKDALNRMDGASETTPPVEEYKDEGWEGKSIAEVEKIMIDKEDNNGSLGLFLLLDDQGVKDETVILADRVWDDDETTEGVQYLNEFNKARVPWIQVYSFWCNLDIANMDFADYCEEDDAEEVTDRWWTFQPVEEPKHYRRFQMLANEEIKKLEEKGLA